MVDEAQVPAAPTDRPRRVAIIGAGPSGLFAAQTLVTQDMLPVEVDVYDRLPTPFGLLRYGVAPDHESIRSVADTLAQVFTDPRVRFCGMVEFGVEFTRADALAAYDAVIYAVGAADDVHLGVPGESALGSTSAREFVAWYGGHPDARPFHLHGARSVATIGVGNVALDVARILLKHPEDLEWTDMPEQVLSQLRSSTVREVSVVGRRGPQHAAFTTKELRELCTLDDVAVDVSPGAFDGIDESALDRRTRGNVQVLRDAAAREVADPRARLHFHFWARPVEIVSEATVDGAPAASGLVLEGTRLDGHVILATGEFETIPADLVLRAIGYRAWALPDVPFDRSRGVIPHAGGRVLEADGVTSPQEYVVGWIKRGPIGVVGTNKSDAAETVAALVEDLLESAPREGLRDPGELLAERGITASTLADWQRIESAEHALGAGYGRERTKVAAWDELMHLVSRRVSPPAR